MKNKVSPELQDQAKKVAKGNQKSGQTKEQTKLITQGIEKGIAEYKKQQNKNLRERDKQRKKELRLKQLRDAEAKLVDKKSQNQHSNKLPWILLVISWLGFAVYLLIF